MTYHDKNHCKKSLDKKGIETPREWGWPLKCEIVFSTGEAEYSCPACGDVFTLWPNAPLPNGLVEQ